MKSINMDKAIKTKYLLPIIPFLILFSSGFMILKKTADCRDAFIGFWIFSKGESLNYYQIDNDPKPSGKLRIFNTEYTERLPAIVFRAGCKENEFQIDKLVTNGVLANGYIYYTTVTGKGMLRNDTITLKINYHYSENGRVSTETWKGIKTTFPGINISDYEK